MRGLRRNVWISLVLGIASVIAIAVSYGALSNIVRGESDISAEIVALRLCFSIIFIFIVFTCFTLVRLLGSKSE